VTDFVTENVAQSVTVSQVSKEVSKKVSKGSKKEKAAELALGAEAGKKPVVFQIPDWVPVTPFEGYIAQRKKIRKPMSERAIELLVMKLEKLRATGEDIGACLDEATLKGWQTVYPLKIENKDRGSKPAHPSFGSTINEAVRRRSGQGAPSAGDRIPRHLADSSPAQGTLDQALLAAPDDNTGGV
jgi:hypothetical protein